MDSNFRMTVKEVLSIKSRGTVVTGRIEKGIINVGDEIYLPDRGSGKTAVVGF